MSRNGCGRVVLMASLMVLGAGSAMPASAAPGLVAATDVAKANGLLRRAEVNLQSVTANIGDRTTWPSGSAGKLLGRRLEQVIGDLNAAKAELDKVPTGAEGRAEAAAKYESMATEYNRLAAIMNGGEAPAAAEPSGTKLNYQQEQTLSNARFHLREVDAGANQLAERVAALRQEADQLSIDFREVRGLLGVIENAERKAGFAREALGQLPADGAGVEPVRQQLADAEAKVAAAAAYLKPLDQRLQQVLNPAAYPELEGDYQRLRDLAIMFARPEIFETDRLQAAEVVAQSEAAQAESVRVARRYARLIQQQTDQGKLIAGVVTGFERNHQRFFEAAAAKRAALPTEIREDLSTAMRYATEAVEEQKPLWFTGGIPQVMGFASERATLLSSLDEAAGKEMRAEIDATSKQLEQMAASLRELIIRENRLPPDRYQGEDREAVIKMAISGWKVQQDEFELLKVRIPSEQWARETKWTYHDGTWYFSDKSRLQVRLFVADHEDPRLVIDRPVTVWKDHQKGDSMYGIPLWNFKKDTLQPSSYLLRQNVE